MSVILPRHSSVATLQTLEGRDEDTSYSTQGSPGVMMNIAGMSMFGGAMWNQPKSQKARQVEGSTGGATTLQANRFWSDISWMLDRICPSPATPSNPQQHRPLRSMARPLSPLPPRCILSLPPPPCLTRTHPLTLTIPRSSSLPLSLSSSYCPSRPLHLAHGRSNPIPPSTERPTGIAATNSYVGQSRPSRHAASTAGGTSQPTSATGRLGPPMCFQLATR